MVNQLVASKALKNSTVTFALIRRVTTSVRCMNKLVSSAYKQQKIDLKQSRNLFETQEGYLR